MRSLAAAVFVTKCPTLGHFQRFAARVRTGNLSRQNRENRFDIRDFFQQASPSPLDQLLAAERTFFTPWPFRLLGPKETSIKLNATYYDWGGSRPIWPAPLVKRILGGNASRPH